MNGKEIDRWQQAIYERRCKAIEGLRDARDGPVGDGRDPLAFSLAEIDRAVHSLHDEIDLLTRERNTAVAEVESLKARPRTPLLDGDGR